RDLQFQGRYSRCEVRERLGIQRRTRCNLWLRTIRHVHGVTLSQHFAKRVERRSLSVRANNTRPDVLAVATKRALMSALFIRRSRLNRAESNRAKHQL